MFNVKLILLAVLLAGTVFLVWHYKATLEENKRLNGEISAANSTIQQLDQKFEAEKIITETTEGIINEIRNSPKTDDAPTAIVLDRALDSL